MESVLTDSKGNYSIATSAGRYQLSAVYPGSSIASAPVAVTAGQTVNKPLYATMQARVSGTVIDEDRRAVAGARIASTFIRGGGASMMLGPAQVPQDANAFSAPDGRFVLRNVGTETDVHISASKK